MTVGAAARCKRVLCMQGARSKLQEACMGRALRAGRRWRGGAYGRLVLLLPPRRGLGF